MSIMLERDFEVLDVVAALVVALDAEGKIIRWNAACSELTGFSLDEVRGRRVWEMFSFPPCAEPKPHSAPLRAGSLPAQFENCWVTRRGDRRWFAWVTKTISVDGGVDAIVATGFDITERKREETELRRSEERFRRLVSAADEYGIVLVDTDCRVITWNAGAERITGYRAGEVLGKDISIFYLPEDVKDGRPRSLMEQAASEGRVRTEEWRKRKDGSRFWARVTTIALRGEESGTVIGFGKIASDETDRKLADDALRESEERFRHLVSDMEEYAIFMLDPEGRIITWNAGATRMKGYTADEIIGKNVSVLYSPEAVERGEPKSELERVARLGQVRQEGWRVRKDGSRFWATVITTAMHSDRTGNLRGFGKVVRDETARKLAEDASRASEERFASIVSLAGEAIVLVDRDEDIVVFNEAAEAMYGYARHEVLGKHFTLLCAPEEAAHHAALFREFVARDVRKVRLGEVAPLIDRRKNGELFPAEATLSKIGEDGSVSAVLRDVSELKRTEDEHHFLDAAWRALVGSLDPSQTIAELASLAASAFADWCVFEIVDEAGRFRRFKVATANRALQGIAEQLEAIPIDEARAHLTSAVIATRRPVLTSELPEGSLQAMAQSAEQLELLRKVNPRSFMAVPLIARGRLVGAAAFLSAESGHRFNARDLGVAEELARRAALAIDNASLFGASQLALRARDEILGIVAHDLRNLLNSLLLAGGSLERNLSESPHRRLAEMCLRPARKMNRLIQDLLDVTSIEAGMLALERTRQPAAALINEALELTRPIVSEHTLDTRMPRDLPEVFADSGRIMEVFSNIIGNAAKFTPAGGHITVGAQRSDGAVRFWVGDSGPGISPDDLPHVFDRFWSAKKRESAGAGLGLAISKGIVEGHGGRIWVESTPGDGATFYFEPPSFEAAQAPQAAAYR